MPVTHESKETRTELTDEEKRANVIRLVFGGDAVLFQEFCTEVAAMLPPDASAVIRGSAVTGVRYEDGAPFDADGPGTSDVDLTLVGASVLDWFTPDGFYIPGAHSKPLSDEHPGVAPFLVPLREKLSRMVRRPVNIQGTRDWTLFVKEVVLGEACLTVVGKIETA
jgi:hypothetical protein